MVFETSCPRCGGGDEGCPRCAGTGEVGHRRCAAAVTVGMRPFLVAADAYETRNLLPVPGGLLDQSAAFVEGIRIWHAEHARIDFELEEVRRLQRRMARS